MANESNRAFGQVVIGLLVVAMGVLFLLDNLGYVGFRHALSFWPIAFMVAGASMMVSQEERNGHVTGLILIAVGLLLLLKHMGLIDISWNMVWPVLLIVVGGLILFRTMGGARVVHVGVHKTGSEAGGKAADALDVTAILGGVQRRVETADFRGGEVTALLGGCDLDLRACSIVKEAVLNVFTVCGGISIKVPPDWTVVLDGVPVAGGFTQKTVPAPDAGKRLVITGYAFMGGVEVSN
jgi:predicted membrane protein